MPLAGCAMGYYVHNGVAKGSTMSDFAVLLLPLAVFGCIAFLIEPRLYIAGLRNGTPQPTVYKIARYILLGATFAIGLYLRYHFFREVHSRP